MARKRLDRPGRALARRKRLRGEPFVEHQRIVAVALVEVRKRRLALGRVDIDQHAERALPVGHVVGLVMLALGERGQSAAPDATI